MVKIADNCVHCPSEMGCYGSCSNKSMERHYCDRCKEEIYDDDLYRESKEEYCQECAEAIIDNWWDNLTFTEKLEYALGER